MNNISVVIPMKNRAHSIAASIESVQRQGLIVDKIVVVDDASTDNSVDVVADMAQKDPRIVLVKNKHSLGGSGARNVGVRHTNSDWVAFLDSDDQWHDNKLTVQIAAIGATPGAVMCFTGLRLVFVDRTWDYICPTNINENRLLLGNDLGSTSSALVERKSFDVAGGFDTSLPSCQDWDLWMRLSRLGSIAVVPAPYVNFTQSGNNRISRNVSALKTGHRLVARRALAATQSYIMKLKIISAHMARLSEIYDQDLNKPVRGTAYAVASLFVFPDRRSFEANVSVLKSIVKTLIGKQAANA